MSNKVIFSTLLLFWVAIFQVKGQDPAFSQFYANPLFLNPAMTGNTECARIALNYRNQWPALSKAYVTYSASYDQNLSSLNSGVGLMLMNDVQGNGIYARTTVGAYYAYNLQLTKDFVLNFGVKGAYYQEKLSGNDLTFADQLNMTTGQFDGVSADVPQKTNLTTMDFGSGLLLGYSNKGYLGFSADHLTEPNLSFYSNGTAKLPMKLTIHSGVSVNLTRGGLGSDNPEDLVIQPNILYQQQNAYKQLNVGFYMSKFPFIFGGWYRNNFSNSDAVMLLVGITYNNIKFGYSYDYTISQLGGSSGGAHEISASWDFCILKEPPRRKIRTIKSPMF